MRIDPHIERVVWRGRYDLHLVRRSGDSVAAAQPLTFKTLEEGEQPPPALSLQAADAQLLMDELWRAGLRPTEGTGSAGSLAATERHLTDMRSIAMGLLKGEF